MKYIKFSFTDKKLNISLPFDKAEAVMNSPETIVKIMDKNGRWTGKTINKSLLMATDEDHEATKASDDEEERIRRSNTPELPEPEHNFTPEEVKQKVNVIRRQVIKNVVVHNHD